MLDDYGGSLSELAREQLPVRNRRRWRSLLRGELCRNRL